MMYDKDKLLLKIANAIVANIGNITRNGLLDGKTGVAFFLYMSARYSSIKFYSDVADDILERLLAVSHDREAVDAKFGRTSVAIGLMQMAYNGFVEMEQIVFEDADKSILVISLIEAQDMFACSIPTLTVKGLGNDWFRVSYILNKGSEYETNPEIVVKVVEENGKYKIDDIRSDADTTLTDKNTIIRAEGLTMPEFVGGHEALQKYMKDNLHYPSYGIRNKIEGRAVISFAVRKDGKLCNIYNVKNCIPCFDNEALRVVRNMPYWTPGRLKGKAVNVRYTLPVSFSM